jgi:hypothetical protein
MSTTQHTADPHVEARTAARRMIAAGDAARAIEILGGLAARDETGEALALERTPAVAASGSLPA